MKNTLKIKFYYTNGTTYTARNVISWDDMSNPAFKYTYTVPKDSLKIGNIQYEVSDYTVTVSLPMDDLAAVEMTRRGHRCTKIYKSKWSDKSLIAKN